LRRYRILQAVATEELNTEIKRLGLLKVDRNTKQLLDFDPSVAGLLALSYKPATTARVLLEARDQGNYDPIRGSFVLLTDGWEVDRWAKTLARHSDLAARLILNGFLRPEVLLDWTPSTQDGAAQYADWIDTVFRGYPGSVGDDAFGERLGFVGRFGQEIQERMAVDENFRSRFAEAVWPALEGAAQVDPTTFAYGNESGLWDFLLDREDGRELIRKIGPYACRFFYGKGSMPKYLHDKTAEFILFGDWKMMDRLLRYSEDALFLSIMNREYVGPGYLATVMELLDEAGEKYPEKLKYLSNLPEEGFLSEIDPKDPGALEYLPGFSTYALIRKMSSGQELGAMDWVGAGLDVITLIPVAAAGKAAKPFATKLVKEGSEAAVAGASRNVRRELGEGAFKRFQKNAEESGEWIYQLSSKGLGKLPKKFREEMLGAAHVDVTPLIKNSFQVGKRIGGNRKSYKRLTDLEARIFMRQDGKVYISLPDVAMSPTGRFLGEAVTGGGLGMASKQLSGSLAKEQEQEQLYKESISAWWLGNASGHFKVKEKEE